MKTLNTLIISSLLVLSMNATASVENSDQLTAKMNQILQSQIDRKLTLTLQRLSPVNPQAMVLNDANATNQKVNSTRS